MSNAWAFIPLNLSLLPSLLGENTFGKGLVQNVRPLVYRTQMKVTIAKYYIPSGRCIQELDYSNKSKDGKAWLGFTTRGSGCGDEIELRAGNDSARYKNGIQNVKSRVIEKYNEPNTEVKQLEKPFTFTDPINPKKTDKEDSYSFKQFWYVYTKPNREKQLGGGPGLKTSSTITVDDLNF
jgi:hypothetical protein